MISAQDPGAPRVGASSFSGGGSIRVLLADHDDTQATRLLERLGDGATSQIIIERETDLSAVLQRLIDERFDALLLNPRVPGLQGLEALARVHEQAPDVPILVLTARDDEPQAMHALKLGAQDSLVVDQIDASLLVRAVRYAIERHQLQMALRAMSLIDDLTGLYNRRGFLTLARQQLKIADRMGKCATQIFLDLDGLKEVNDRFGHRDGDLALIETADILKELFRDSDIIARIGGDEFVVLALESGARAESFLDRVREKLSARNSRGTRPFALSLSVGIAHYDPASPCSIDDLLARADALMYAEKRNKRNRLMADYPGPLPKASASRRAD
jgi:two-component system, cell cycle response regulator